MIEVCVDKFGKAFCTTLALLGTAPKITDIDDKVFISKEHWNLMNLARFIKTMDFYVLPTHNSTSFYKEYSTGG